MVGTHFGSDPLQSVINSIISVSIEALRSIVFIARSPNVIVKVGNYNFINAGILHPQGILRLTPLGERGRREEKRNSLFSLAFKDHYR